MIRRSIIQQAQQASYATSPLRNRSLVQTTQYLSSRLPAPARARILSRWYSADSAQSKESDESLGQGSPSQAEPTVEGSAPPAEENPLKKELEAKNREALDFKDKYLRQVAEYRNLQERTRREVQAAKDFAIQRFAKDLVESIDTFDLALSAVPADKLAAPTSSDSQDPNSDLRQLHGGLRMTETVLMNTLKKNGLERFDPSVNGEKFDPNLHEAMFQTPQPDKTDGTVFHTTQKGFMLNGRVLRAAKVGVVRNS